jgi:predicted permease
MIMGMKLVVHPLAAWLLGKYLFHLPPSLLHPAVLLAALPTGTGPYMLAELYQREAGITSKAIIGSTLLSILTITAYLTFGR